MVRIYLKVTENELAIFDKVAKRRGLTRSQLLRKGMEAIT